MSCLFLMEAKRPKLTLLATIRNVVLTERVSIVPVLSAPRGMITSANFLVGKQNSSKAGFTVLIYW